jgi:hypothetical protein
MYRDIIASHVTVRRSGEIVAAERSLPQPLWGKISFPESRTMCSLPLRSTDTTVGYGRSAPLCRTSAKSTCSGSGREALPETGPLPLGRITPTLMPARRDD